MRTFAIRKNGRIRGAFYFTGAEQVDALKRAIGLVADETGHTRETVAEETRNDGKLCTDDGAEWTISDEPMEEETDSRRYEGGAN
jgi:hypothetical protein